MAGADQSGSATAPRGGAIQGGTDPSSGDRLTGHSSMGRVDSRHWPPLSASSASNRQHRHVLRSQTALPASRSADTGLVYNTIRLTASGLLTPGVSAVSDGTNCDAERLAARSHDAVEHLRRAEVRRHHFAYVVTQHLRRPARRRVVDDTWRRTLHPAGARCHWQQQR